MAPAAMRRRLLRLLPRVRVAQAVMHRQQLTLPRRVQLAPAEMLGRQLGSPVRKGTRILQLWGVTRLGCPWAVEPSWMSWPLKRTRKKWRRSRSCSCERQPQLHKRRALCRNFSQLRSRP